MDPINCRKLLSTAFWRWPVLKGFGFLQNIIVIPHVIQRHWEGRMAEAEAQHAGMLGVGIDVGCALVVHGGAFDVIGASKVLIPTHSGNNPGLETLLPGDRFDLVTRMKPGGPKPGFGR